MKRLNEDERVDGILIQMPLPKGLDADKIMDTIDPAKDADGFHPYNTGMLAQKRPKLRPCTPYGVIVLAKTYGIDLVGKRAVVVGASNIVGRPMALELLLARSTVTVCHTGTKDVRAEVERAEIGWSVSASLSLFRVNGFGRERRYSMWASTACRTENWWAMSATPLRRSVPAGSHRCRAAWGP